MTPPSPPSPPAPPPIAPGWLGWLLSIRTRLALWYTATLGVVLLLLASATYVTLANTTSADRDAALEDVAVAVAASLQLALASVPPSIPTDSAAVHWAAERTLANHRFRDIGVALYLPADGPPPGALRLLAADTVSLATREAGADDAWRRDSSSALRALARMDTDRVTVEPHRERVVSVPVRTSRGLFVVSLSQSLAAHDGVLRRMREAFLIGVPLALVLAMAGGLALSAASLRPVETMRQRAEQVTARTLDARLPVSPVPDELSRLARTFNAMLDRVQEAFEQRRRFTADASHELRTPVAIVIGEAELALAEERDPTQYRSALQVILGEAQRLARIVSDLILLARTDAAEQALVPAPLYLEELAGDCLDAMASLARRRGIRLVFTPDREVPCRGDATLLRRVLMNLLDNAIKYCPAGSTVRVEAEPASEGGALVRVIDDGPGIPAEHQARIFERFYRAQHTTQRDAQGAATGAGLGLAIAFWIAQAHGGTLRLTHSGPRGTCFTLTLPPGPPAPAALPPVTGTTAG